jgi:hypothetical protein
VDLLSQWRYYSTVFPRSRLRCLAPAPSLQFSDVSATVRSLLSQLPSASLWLLCLPCLCVRPFFRIHLSFSILLPKFLPVASIRISHNLCKRSPLAPNAIYVSHMYSPLACPGRFHHKIQTASFKTGLESFSQHSGSCFI